MSARDDTKQDSASNPEPKLSDILEPPQPRFFGRAEFPPDSWIAMPFR